MGFFSWKKKVYQVSPVRLGACQVLLDRCTEMRGNISKLENKGEYILVEVVVMKSERNMKDGLEYLRLGSVNMNQVMDGEFHG
jgi:hypothetical protein